MCRKTITLKIRMALHTAALCVLAASCSGSTKSGILVLKLQTFPGIELGVELRVTLDGEDVRNIALSNLDLKKPELLIGLEDVISRQRNGVVQVSAALLDSTGCALASMEATSVVIKRGGAVTLGVSLSQNIPPACDVDATNQQDAATGGDGASLDGSDPDQCPTGEFLTSNDDGGFTCHPSVTCPAGTYVAAVGQEGEDRTCRSCPAGSFSDVENSPACTPWAVCAIGEFISEAGTDIRNQTCSPCPDGKYTAIENSSACADKGSCAAGTEQTAAASPTRPPTCAVCSAGNYCAGGTSPKQTCIGSTWDHDANPGSACVAKTNCVAGQFVLAEGDNSTDRTCGPCALGRYSATTNATECLPWSECPPGQYVKMVGTSLANRTCAECATGSFAPQVNSLGCTSWRSCESGFYVTNTPSAIVDRACMECPGGTFTSQPNQSSCVPQGSCAAGTEQTVAATNGSPPVCKNCSAGTYCAGGTSPSAPCAGETWDHDNNPATACAPKTKCAEGTFVKSGGSATADRICEKCMNAFSSGTNASACVGWRDCDPGSYVSSAPSLSQDRGCSPCKSGEFSTAKNSPSCALLTDCQPGFEVVDEPTSSRDRTCAPCASGTYTSQVNQTACLPQGACAAGTVQTAAGNATTPATCAACSAGNYCSGGTAASQACGGQNWDHDSNAATACIAKRTCSAGFVSTAEGSATADRECTACAAGNYCAGGNTAAVACAAGSWDHDESSATACQSKVTCDPGFRVASEGSSTTPRTCSACTSGYSNTSNAPSCTGWTTCEPGQYVTMAPSSTTNRSCGACADGLTTVGQNQTTCGKPVVAVGDWGDIFAGVGDPVQWTKATLNNVASPQPLYGVARGASYYIAAGIGGSILKATNPATWNVLSPATGGNISEVVYCSGYFVMPGDDSTIKVLNESSGSVGAYSGGPSTSYLAAACSPTTFVVAGSNGRILYAAAEGAPIWKLSDAPQFRFLSGLAYGNGVFVAVGEYGTVFRSTNGSSWTQVTQYPGAGQSSHDLKAVAFGDGRFIAVGNAPSAYYSDDLGLTWQPLLDSPNSDAYLFSVAYDPQSSRFFFGGNFGKIWYSKNKGVTWQENNPAASQSQMINAIEAR
jgi:hypothetical protein